MKYESLVHYIFLSKLLDKLLRLHIVIIYIVPEYLVPIKFAFPISPLKGLFRIHDTNSFIDANVISEFSY